MVLDTDIQEKLQAHREAKKEVTPQVTNTEKVVEAEDLEQLKKLQADMDTLVVSFGQVAIQETALIAQKETLNKTLVDIKQRELDLAKELSSKYGEGSLNLETGKFSATT
jgi:hypothetical protein|tara:strand:- start:600 stop:929 length:330 start_codon:yes stop_codon:yes gene_type:complete